MSFHRVAAISKTVAWWALGPALHMCCYNLSIVWVLFMCSGNYHAITFKPLISHVLAKARSFKRKTCHTALSQPLMQPHASSAAGETAFLNLHARLACHLVPIREAFALPLIHRISRESSGAMQSIYSICPSQGGDTVARYR